ncbi:hypothetical protein ABPG72_022711 [Tetrahymena utriculariae]
MGNSLFKAPECFEPNEYDFYFEQYRSQGVLVDTRPTAKGLLQQIQSQQNEYQQKYEQKIEELKKSNDLLIQQLKNQEKIILDLQNGLKTSEFEFKKQKGLSIQNQKINDQQMVFQPQNDGIADEFFDNFFHYIEDALQFNIEKGISYAQELFILLKFLSKNGLLNIILVAILSIVVSFQINNSQLIQNNRFSILFFAVVLFKVFKQNTFNNRIYHRFYLRKINRGFISLMQIFFNLFIVSPFFACIWLVVGKMNQTEESISCSSQDIYNSIDNCAQTWHDKLKGILNLTFYEQYLRAYYITTLKIITVGYGDINPVKMRKYYFLFQKFQLLAEYLDIVQILQDKFFQKWTSTTKNMMNILTQIMVIQEKDFYRFTSLSERIFAVFLHLVRPRRYLKIVKINLTVTRGTQKQNNA